MDRYQEYENSFMRIQGSLALAMALFLVVWLIIEPVPTLFIFVVILVFFLTGFNYFASRLKNYKPFLFYSIKLSHLLAYSLLLLSDNMVVFSVGAVTYLFFGLELMITLGSDPSKKSSIYTIMIVPIVIHSLLIIYEKQTSYILLFFVILVILIFGIYRILMMYNEAFTRRIEFQAHDLEESINQNLNLEQSQIKLKQVYEQLSQQKYELEKTNKSLEKMTAEMYIQNELLQYITATLEIDQLLDLVTDSVIGATGCDACSMLIYEDDGVQFYAESKSTHDVDATERFRKIIKAGEMAPYLESKEIIVDMDVELDEYIFSSLDLVGSMIMVPLVRNDRVYGALIAEHHNKNFFGDSAIEFFKAIATQVNIAVNNAGIYSRMEELARTDALTNIYNRRTFQELLDELYKKYKLENKHFSVILFDIDHFKAINDTYGHIFGDSAITMVASIVKSYAEDTGGFAGRYGGEEFVMVLPGKNGYQAYGIVSMMHEEIKATPLIQGDEKVYLDVSIGITPFPEFGESAEDLLNRADNAMYCAKAKGRGRIEMDSQQLNENKAEK